jgi:hypothetical protein
MNFSSNPNITRDLEGAWFENPVMSRVGVITLGSPKTGCITGAIRKLYIIKL